MENFWLGFTTLWVGGVMPYVASYQKNHNLITTRSVAIGHTTTFFIACCWFIASKQTIKPIFCEYSLWLFGIGILNAFGCTCYVNANQHHKGATGICSPVTTITAITLAGLFLGEGRYFGSYKVIIGLILSLVGLSLTSYFKQTSKNGKSVNPLKAIPWALGAFGIGGIATYYMKKNSNLNVITHQQYLVVWYGASCISAHYLYFLHKFKFAEHIKTESHKLLSLSTFAPIGLGICMFMNTFNRINLYEYFDVSEARPIVQFGEITLPIILPVLVAAILILFKKEKVKFKSSLNLPIIGSIGLATIGIVIMFTSLRGLK